MSNVVQFPSPTGRGDFFAVDAKTWGEICKLGSINIPIAYLVMARGTGHDNVTTSWSTNAVEQRTKISRPQAKKAVQGLIASKRVILEKGGQHPRYKLTAAASAEDWIWLPNALIDGAAGETSPIELLRQSQSLHAIQLFVDLYQAQSLANVGGVHWRQLRTKYDRVKVGERGKYVVWGFSSPNSYGVFDTIAPFVVGKPVAEHRKLESGKKQLVFWDALAVIRNIGLAECVGHIVDADTNEAEVVHPYAVGNGELGERVISLEAHRAGLALLTEGQRDWAEERSLHLLPAERHRENVQLMGLLRLRYRARTAATASWYDPAKWEEIAASYRRISAEESVVSSVS